MWPRELAPAEHQQTLTQMHGEAAGTAAGAGGRDTPASPGVLQRVRGGWCDTPVSPGVLRRVWASSWPRVTAAECGRRAAGGRPGAAGSCAPAGCVARPSYFHVPVFDIVLQSLPRSPLSCEITPFI